MEGSQAVAEVNPGVKMGAIHHHAKTKTGNGQEQEVMTCHAILLVQSTANKSLNFLPSV